MPVRIMLLTAPNSRKSGLKKYKPWVIMAQVPNTTKFLFINDEKILLVAYYYDGIMKQ